MLIALDTDVFTDVMYGDPVLVARLLAVSIAEQTLPIVVIEEVIRVALTSSAKQRPVAVGFCLMKPMLGSNSR